MSVNLNEFSTEELQVLLNLVVYKIVDLQLHRYHWEKYFGDNIPIPYEIQAPEAMKQKEILEKFRVQILNAIVEVKLKEEMISN